MLLATNTSWIGIDDAIEARVEVPVVGPTGALLSDIDLLVRTDSRIVVVEYKLARVPMHEYKRRHSALSQLERIDRRFASVFGFAPDLVYAYGDRFTYEHVRSGTRFRTAPDLGDVARVLAGTSSGGFLNGSRRLPPYGAMG